MASERSKVSDVKVSKCIGEYMLFITFSHRCMPIIFGY